MNQKASVIRGLFCSADGPEAAGNAYELDWREREFEKTCRWKCRCRKAAFAGRHLEQSAHDDCLRRADAGHSGSRVPDCERLVKHPVVSRLFTSAG